MQNPLRRVYNSLSEPRVLTGITVVAYTVLFCYTVVLWLDILPTLYGLPWQEMMFFSAPAVLLAFGSIGGIIESWKNGRDSGIRERVALVAALTGLWGSVLLESRLLLDFDMASVLLVTLTVLVSLAVMARMHWLIERYNLN